MFPFYTPMESPENLWFYGIFRSYYMEALTRNKLIMVKQKKTFTEYQKA